MFPLWGHEGSADHLEALKHRHRASPVPYKESIMSKYMHLTVTVLPYYPRDLEETYPKLARHLKSLASDLVARNPSLYEIAGQLDKLLYTFDGTPLRDVFLRHRENLRTIYKSIEENIADWNLAEADRLLYKIEDAFDQIESELD
jgi:hypothetical protein